MDIKRYTEEDCTGLFTLLQREGEEWACYHTEKMADQYAVALRRSITYVVYENDVLCGYLRCRDDDGFGVYIYDLLVDKAYRGKYYGRLLMERVCTDFPQSIVYVLSDVDVYYKKLGYQREGTVFIVKPQ